MYDDSIHGKVLVKGICHPPSDSANPRPINLFEEDFENAKKQIKEGIPACFEHADEIGKCVDAEITSQGLEISMEIDPNLNSRAAKMCQELKKTDGEPWSMSLSHSYKRRKSEDEEVAVSASANDNSPSPKTVRIPDSNATWEMHMKEVSIVKVPGREGCIVKSAVPLNDEEGIVCASGNLIYVDKDGYKCIPEQGIVQRNSASALIIMEAEAPDNKNADLNNKIEEVTNNVVQEPQVDSNLDNKDGAQKMQTETPPADKILEENEKEKESVPDMMDEDSKTDEQAAQVLQSAMQEIQNLRQELSKRDEEVKKQRRYDGERKIQVEFGSSKFAERARC